VYERPNSPEQPSPFAPTNSNQIPPGKTPGTMKTPGQPDVHGYVQSPQNPGDKPIFYPDPPGSKLGSN